MPNINEPLEWNDSLKLEFFEVIYRVSGAEEVSDVFDKFIKYKQRKPLFTTEDGVDIFEGDKYYAVIVDNFNIIEFKSDSKYDAGYLNSYYPDVKRFSTEEKANEYILMNKPLLSINDFRSCQTDTKYLNNNHQYKKLIEIAKSKLNG